METSRFGMAGLTMMVVACALVLVAGVPSAEGQEIDPNDFRVSFMGGSGSTIGSGLRPRLACRDSVDECLVVWTGADDFSGAQVFGQRFDGDTADALGSRILISSMSEQVWELELTHIPSVDRYLVVWTGYHDVGGGQMELEVFGQLIDATTGAEVGVDDFRISYLGPPGDLSYQTLNTSVAYNPIHNELLVTWTALFPGGGNIWGQRLNAATGAAIGANFLISGDATPELGTDRNKLSVVHDAQHDEYLVVWMGRIESQGTGWEVFGQRLDGATAAEIGIDDFRISFTGIDGVAVADHFIWALDAAYSPGAGRYIISWTAQDDPEPQMALEWEVYMQAIAGGSGDPVGDRIRLSDMGGFGAVAFGVSTTSLTCDQWSTCLVVWDSDETGYGGLVNDEVEIFGQLVDAGTLSEFGANDFRLSDMGPNGNPDYDAMTPAVAFIPGLHRYLTVWWGDNLLITFPQIVDDEYEIWGQLVEGGIIFGDGFETGSTDRWDDVVGGAP